ncbi:hypothetical protein [Arthrobacter sp. E3]|uniref:hypothetical protein n=1 Tax=Arthrobacter sp. E3 TaxID=517402 RepID=UPI001A94C3B4|nr:hypothetical protein [Arthrobacter sp. E3]
MSRSENMERAVHSQSRTVVIVAWITILAVSLPEIILREMFHYVPSEGLRIAFPVGVAFAGLALTFLWKSIRRLREFFGLLLVLVVSQWWVYTRIAQLPFLQSWMEDTSFTVRMIVDQSMRLTVTGIIIVLLFILKNEGFSFLPHPGIPRCAGDSGATVRNEANLALECFWAKPCHLHQPWYVGISVDRGATLG